MDSALLAEMLSLIEERDYEIDSILIIRNGYLVTDIYVHPFAPNTKHVINSCTKSVVSALIGIVVDEGYIHGVDQPILEIFSDRDVANLEPSKEQITLEDVLSMSSGLDCKDSYLYRWSGLREMWNSEDWVQFVLDLPMAHEPGTYFEYCNGGSFLLSAVVQERTGKTALDFANEKLFGPLGIENVTWRENPQGISIGWGGLEMIPYDMAKIGYLYLNGGEWDGGQIIPSSWVESSTTEHIDATLQDGYGYQWWVDDDGVYMALGYAGQFIFVMPEKSLVVVFTSDLKERDFYVPQQLLEAYIIPAAQSSQALPKNTKGVEQLELMIERLAQP